MTLIQRVVHRAAATFSLDLDGRTGRVAPRAENTAIARFRRKTRAAAGTVVNDDAGVRRHSKRLMETAARTR